MTDWMTQDLVNTRNYHDIFKRITRYTFKPIGIIVDRMAPPNNEPTVDPEGEWMKCEQLNNIISLGGLIEYTPELKELLLDGHAQRGLIRDIGNLGYTDFEQVMEILKNNRHQLLDTTKYEIWSEGYQASPDKGTATKHATVEGFCFHDAIAKYVATLAPENAKHWHYFKDRNEWTMDGCKTFDNEADARKSYG